MLFFMLSLSLAHAAGSLNDVEHLVFFMQENRAYDHYYGKMHGVRGFNDRAHPPLPNGKPVWYQNTAAPPSQAEALCGCGSCDIEWAKGSEDLKNLIMSFPCNVLMDGLKGALPPVTVTAGESCEQLLKDMMGTTIDHMKVADLILNTSSCAVDLHVNTSATPAPQPDTDNYILPFPLHFSNTSASCMGAPSMGYFPDIPIWNEGRMDSWNSARSPGYGMSYFSREDLPFYYALADEYTIGDQYYQSTFTATNPNRLHFFTGSNGLSVDSEYCILDDSEPKTGINWTTLGDELEAAGISWQVYQEADNFDDNAFAWFDQYKNAKPGSALYEKGLKRDLDLVKAFDEALSKQTLPQVSIIVGPAWRSEHATNHPADGEDLSAQLIKTLGKYPDMYSKTAFIINYDEGGQFFDHHWTPTPPANTKEGLSTVTVEGEITKVETQGIPAGNPIGLGFRVPMMIVSPWTRGGYVYSGVADHTSMLKLVEKRFGIHMSTISPWRRAVTSDLTDAFDFQNPDFSFPSNLPDTSGNVNASRYECENLPSPKVPEEQHMPSQYPGTRPSRPLPYVRSVVASVAPAGLSLKIMNSGAAGTQAAVFQVYNMLIPEAAPKRYTVEAGKSLLDTWALINEAYSLAVYGTNGFVRHFVGDLAASKGLSVQMAYSPTTQEVVLNMQADQSTVFQVSDMAYGTAQQQVTVKGQVSHKVSVSSSGNWYDLSVAVAEVNFSRRFMGRMETGAASVSDPAMAQDNTPLYQDEQHPKLSAKLRQQIETWHRPHECRNERSWYKDACASISDDISAFDQL